MLDTIFHYATFMFVKGRVEGKKERIVGSSDRSSTDMPQNPRDQAGPPEPTFTLSERDLLPRMQTSLSRSS